jgi:hypothetical protein
MVGFNQLLHKAFNRLTASCPIYHQMRYEAYRIVENNVLRNHQGDIDRICKYHTRRVKSGKILEDEVKILITYIQSSYK